MSQPWTDERIREAFIYDGGESEYHDPINGAQTQRKIAGGIFDSWLSEHDRQVAERAWDEGYEAAAEFHEGREKGHWENDFPAKGMRTWRPDPAPTSPYRAAKGEQK